MVSAEQTGNKEVINTINGYVTIILNKLSQIEDLINKSNELSAERNAIMSEPDKLSQDDLIFPPLDDELKTEGD